MEKGRVSMRHAATVWTLVIIICIQMVLLNRACSVIWKQRVNQVAHRLANPITTVSVNTPIRAPKLYVKSSPVHGNGVFADADFQPDDVIEQCPLMIFSQEDRYVVARYAFGYRRGGTVRVALGYGSLYNHSNTPNAEFMNTDDHMLLVASKEIRADEEITINYGEPYWKFWNQIEGAIVQDATTTS